MKHTKNFGFFRIYIFESPNRVDDRLDFSVFEKSEDFADDVLNVCRAVLLVQQVTQIETGEGLVFVEELDWGDFVDLPPLRKEKKSYLRLCGNQCRNYRTRNAEEAFGFARDDVG
jgi:hypothetical protein